MALNNRRGRPGKPTIDDLDDDETIIADRGQNSQEDDTQGLEDESDSEEMESVSNTPSELTDLIQELGISGDFKTTLWKLPEGKRTLEVIANYDCRVPSVEEFASEFGGGQYLLVISWYVRVSGKQKAQRQQKKIKISVGNNYDLVAQKRKLKNTRDFQMENYIPQLQAPEQGIDKTLDMFVKLQQLTPKQDNMASMMAAVLGPIVAIMTQSNQQMMAMGQQNMNMMFQMMGNKKSSVEEMKEMLELSNLMGGNKQSSIWETLITEGAGMFKEYAPVVKEAISKLNNPFLKKIASKEILQDPRIVEILADPEKRAAFIEHLYNTEDTAKVDNALLELKLITIEQKRA